MMKPEELTFDEINAILVHKWLLSEKQKRDVGFEFAMEDFFRNHAEEWRKKRLEEDVRQQKEEIEKHRWFLSQKMGRELTRSEAALDWIKSGFAEHWRNRTGPYKDRR